MNNFFAPGLNYNKEPSTTAGVFEKMGNNPFPLRKADNLSIKQEPTIVYDTNETNVVVCSNDRDAVAYPSPNHYRINLPVSLNNVKSIELVTVILPDRAASGSILDEPCLYISLEDGKNSLNHLEFSNDNINNSFAVLPLKPAAKSGGFLIPDFACNFNTPNVFKTPLAKINSLTISITDIYGHLFNFGTDTSPPTKALQNVFVFKITTLEKSMDKLGARGVFP